MTDIKEVLKDRLNPDGWIIRYNGESFGYGSNGEGGLHTKVFKHEPRLPDNAAELKAVKYPIYMVPPALIEWVAHVEGLLNVLQKLPGLDKTSEILLETLNKIKHGTEKLRSDVQQENP